LLAAVPASSQDAASDAADDGPTVTREGAKDDESKVFEGEITVEGSPIVASSEVDVLGSLVTAVTEQQIDDLYAQDLTGALRRVPGVIISRYNPVGAFGGGDGGAFFIRGHGSGRPGGEVTFLTDGVPRFVGIWTHPLIDVGNIDSMHRLDIYRSAQPVLLGNMAFAAVDISSKRRMAPGFGGRFTGSYGSFDTLVGNLELGGRSDRFDYFLTAGYRTSDGHRDNAGGEITALSGRIGFALSEHWDLSVLSEHTSSSVDDPGAVGAPPLPIVPDYDIDNDFVLATLSHHHGEWAGSVKLYLDAGTFDWLQWSASEQHAFRSVTDSENVGVRWRETTTPWAGGELVVGIDHDKYGGEFVERHPGGDRLASDLTFRNTAPYVALSHTFDGTVSVTPSAGVRYNDSRYFGGDWGAQAGINLGFGDHQLYANAARGFNLPGIYAAVQYGGWGRGDQWQELEAETIDHVEVGWLGAFGRCLRLTASVFRDEVDDAIRFVPPPPPPPLFANVGAYAVDGVEVSVQVEPNDSLSLFLGGTYSSSDPDTVPNLPETTGVAGLTWIGPGDWRLNLDLQWLDDRHVLNPRFAAGSAAVDGYLLANAKLDLPWRLLGLELEGAIFIVGENLLDEDYEHRLGYPMPGRMVQAGVDIRF
jgi:iron complex outermembrane receptor protein